MGVHVVFWLNFYSVWAKVRASLTSTCWKRAATENFHGRRSSWIWSWPVSKTSIWTMKVIWHFELGIRICLKTLPVRVIEFLSLLIFLSSNHYSFPSSEECWCCIRREIGFDWKLLSLILFAYNSFSLREDHLSIGEYYRHTILRLRIWKMSPHEERQKEKGR